MIALCPGQFKDYLNRAEYLKGVAGQDNCGPEQGQSAATAQKVKKAGAKDEVSSQQSFQLPAHDSSLILM
jgi:hypothetical protein